MAAKCASMFSLRNIPDLLAPCQLGFGVPQGVEVAVHAAQIYLCSLQSDQVIVKVDFKNAFNGIRRDKILLEVEEFTPALLPFVHSAYCIALSMMRGCEVVKSSEGVQQGDPLVPYCSAWQSTECVQSLSQSSQYFT